MCKNNVLALSIVVTLLIFCITFSILYDDLGSILRSIKEKDMHEFQMSFQERVGIKNASLSLTLKLEKEKYAVGEPININVSLKNEGDTNIRVCDLDFENGYLEFIILSPAGDILKRISPIKQGIAKAVVLAPGEEISYTYSLTKLYDFDKLRGSFTVIARYTSGTVGMSPNSSQIVSTWSGVVYSNALKFQIITEEVFPRYITAGVTMVVIILFVILFLRRTKKRKKEKQWR